MNRMLIATLVLAGLGGGALGWGVLGRVPNPREGAEVVSAVDPGEGPSRDGDRGEAVLRGSATDRQEFPLLPADVTSIREAPSLAVAPDGSVLLAWASQTGRDERTLMLARADGGGWPFAPAVPWRIVPTYTWTVTHNGREMTHATQVLPRLATAADEVVLGWVEAEAGGPSASFLAARSDDGGRTFGPPFALNGEEAPRPGFTALGVDRGGAVLASWIDNRNGPQQPFFRRHGNSEEDGATDRLVFAGPEGLGICPCCDTAVIETTGGRALVAFRNGEGGHRDIWLARESADGTFEDPVPVAPDRRWSFQGCPHDGPSLVEAGGRILVAWMDGSSGTDRVAVAGLDAASLAPSGSRDLDPDVPGAQGHPRLVVAADGSIHAAWEATLDASTGGDEGGRAIRYARLGGDGSVLGSAAFVDPRPGAYQTHPALAVGRAGEVFVAWNELDEAGKRVVVERIRPGPESSDRSGE